MLSAIGEAIFALAMERAPNVVKLCSYAPLLQNFNGYQWTVSLSPPPERIEAVCLLTLYQNSLT